MALRINTNIAALNSHRNLQKNDAAMGKTLEALSSGMKINRGADGPASLVISEQMRAQVAGLTQAVMNSESAVSMVQTAEAALNEVSSLLTGMRQLAIHAANEGVNDTVMLEADQAELQNALDSIERISKTSQFGTKNLLDGTMGVTGNASGEGLQFINAGTKTESSPQSGYAVDVMQEATQAHLAGTTALTQDMINEGETLTINNGEKSVQYKTQLGDSLDNIQNNLNNKLRDESIDISVFFDDQGLLHVTHGEYGSEPSFSVISTSAGVLSEDGNIPTFVQNGQDIQGTIGEEYAVGKGQFLTGGVGTNVEGLTVRFTGNAAVPPDIGGPGGPMVAGPSAGAQGPALGAAPGEEGAEGVPGAEGAAPEGAAPVAEENVNVMPALNQKSDLVDSTVGHVSIHSGALTFQIGANEDQFTRVILPNTSVEHLGTKVDNESGFKSLGEMDIRSFQGAQDSLRLIDQAIDEVSSIRAELGAVQKNTLESNITSLNIAKENLSNAESVIRDTDMALEMSEFTKNQILSQSATAMLAQANQSPNNVLSLLK